MLENSLLFRIFCFISVLNGQGDPPALFCIFATVKAGHLIPVNIIDLNASKFTHQEININDLSIELKGYWQHYP